MSAQHTDTVTAVYELRKAAVEHGRAMAEADRSPRSEARDHLIATTLQLEEKTAAALDECADHAEEAVEEAVERSA
jgi:hypothetical protein